MLRSTSDLKVWKTVLFGLLLADIGHLYSVRSLGLGIYYRAWSWNAMHWGNIGFVYLGASKCSFSSRVNPSYSHMVDERDLFPSRKRTYKGTELGGFRFIYKTYANCDLIGMRIAFLKGIGLNSKQGQEAAAAKLKSKSK